MKFESIENLIVWQKARTLTIEAIAVFHWSNDELIKDMITRNCISIMNTIAEAYERPSRKELIEDLYAAKWTCGACRSMLHLSVELGLIDNATHHKLIDASLDVTKLLAWFIKKLKEAPKVAPAE